MCVSGEGARAEGIQTKSPYKYLAIELKLCSRNLKSRDYTDVSTHAIRAPQWCTAIWVLLFTQIAGNFLKCQLGNKLLCIFR